MFFHPPYAQIHDHNGSFLATLLLPRFFWLWEFFFNLLYVFPFLRLAPGPSPYGFCHKISPLEWKIHKKTPKTKHVHHSSHKQPSFLTGYNYSSLITHFTLTHSYFLSPLTCPLQCFQYYSPHKIDILIESIGPTFSY